MRGSLLARSAFVAAVTFAALGGLSGSTRPADAAGSPHVLFGAYVNHAYPNQDRRQQLATLERFLGRTLAIDHLGFFSWSGSLPATILRTDIAGRRWPFMSWHQIASDRISNGSQDAFIRKRAAALKAFGGRIFLQFAGEMDRKAVAGTPQQFIAAWDHVVALFRAARASNVEFVWCPTAFGFTTGRAQPFFPGDDEVDWICADGYNWGTAHPTSVWRSFPQVFADFFTWAQGHAAVPIVLGEWASVEDPDVPGRKAMWINNARLKVEQRYPQIGALVYFDTNGWDATTQKLVDWRANTSDSAYAAFKQMAADPYYGAR
jgi:hypothetical protein